MLLAGDHSLGRWQRHVADLTQRTGVQTMWYEKGGGGLVAHTVGYNAPHASACGRSRRRREPVSFERNKRTVEGVLRMRVQVFDLNKVRQRCRGTK